jgi:hypothetical protein
MTEPKVKPVEHMTATELQQAYDQHCAWYGDAMLQFESLQKFISDIKQKVNQIGERLAKTRESQQAVKEVIAQEAAIDTAPSSVNPEAQVVS